MSIQGVRIKSRYARKNGEYKRLRHSANTLSYRGGRMAFSKRPIAQVLKSAIHKREALATGWAG